jgi:hypothetical protein
MIEPITARNIGDPVMNELSNSDLDQVSGGRGGFDGLGDLRMEKQMRLQMYMQPFAQTAAMISNILHKASHTSSGIVQNLK